MREHFLACIVMFDRFSLSYDYGQHCEHCTQRDSECSSITSSCREGSSSSSSSYSISEDEDEDEDEDERQPGFSFPVTPAFLRGEAARQAVF